MIFRNKNKGKLRMTELFSNEFFQLSLEDLDWIHGESKGHAFEHVKISTVEDKSLFFAIILRALTKPLKFGDYVYSRSGSDMLERTSPLIKKKTTLFKKFKLSSPIKIRIKKKESEGGLVTKVT